MPELKNVRWEKFSFDFVRSECPSLKRRARKDWVRRFKALLTLPWNRNERSE